MSDYWIYISLSCIHNLAWAIWGAFIFSDYKKKWWQWILIGLMMMISGIIAVERNNYVAS